MTRVTHPQLAKIWTTAKERGIQPDLVRSMTPAGSVGSLTVAQASELIDALVKGRSPDYSRVAARAPAPPASCPANSQQPTANSSSPRRPAGVIRQATSEQLIADRQYVDWFVAHWRRRDGTRWTVAAFEAFMSGKHYKSHGGPMNMIRDSHDCVERRELFKAMKLRTLAKEGDPQAKRELADWRLRQAESTTKGAKRHEDRRAVNPPLRDLRALRGSSSPPPPLRLVRSDRPDLANSQQLTANSSSQATECHYADTQ